VKKPKHFNPYYSYPINYHRGKAQGRRQKKQKKRNGSILFSIKGDTAELRERSNQIPNMAKIYELIGKKLLILVHLQFNWRGLSI